MDSCGLPVCYISQLNSTSERLLSDLMWFLLMSCNVGPGLYEIILQDVVFRIMECDLQSPLRHEIEVVASL